nr:hypothetical protein [Tanacetum cinerariifolium]
MPLPPNPSCQIKAFLLDGVYKFGSRESTKIRRNYSISIGEKTQGILMDCQGGNLCDPPPSNQWLGLNCKKDIE